jgi:hypothetical protein
MGEPASAGSPASHAELCARCEDAGRTATCWREVKMIALAAPLISA